MTVMYCAQVHIQVPQFQPMLDLQVRPKTFEVSSILTLGQSMGVGHSTFTEAV